jgi:hypothetical protein
MEKEVDMSSIKRFRDSLPPRSEDMMPKHPAEDDVGTKAMLAGGCFDPREGGRDEPAPPSDREETYWKGTCEIRELELTRLRKYIENDEWLKYKQMLNHANTACITGHVMDPNGPEEERWGKEIDRIERRIQYIEELIDHEAL